MIPACVVAEASIYRQEHVYVDGRCTGCLQPQQVLVPMLELWRAAISTVEPRPLPSPPRPPRVVPLNGSARLPQDVDTRIRKMIRAGVGVNRTARECDVSRQAVRRRIAEMELELTKPATSRKVARWYRK